MDFTLKLYPSRALELHGSAEYLGALIKEGVIKEEPDGSVMLCRPIKLKLNDSGAKKLDTFLEQQWLPLFPTQKIKPTNISDYHVSGNKAKCRKEMQAFLNKHKSVFPLDTILICTAAYLYGRKIQNWNGVSKNFNFIRKDLESWCLDFLDNPNEIKRQAKAYYEHIRRHATRKRGKHISHDRYRLPTLVGSADGGSDVAVGTSSNGRTTNEPVGTSGVTDGGGHIQPAKPIRLAARAITINKAHKG